MRNLNELKKWKISTLDGRDIFRLQQFWTAEEVKEYRKEQGWEDDYDSIHEQVEYTKENVMRSFEKDVVFAFKKALDCRGLSSMCMFEVVKMWLWVLEDELQNWEEYGFYGLPLYKEVAVKYGFNNEIGDDTGTEEWYSEESPISLI